MERLLWQRLHNSRQIVEFTRYSNCKSLKQSCRYFAFSTSRRSASGINRAPPILTDGKVPSAIHRRTVRTFTLRRLAISRARRYCGRSFIAPLPQEEGLAESLQLPAGRQPSAAQAFPRQLGVRG